MKRTLEILFELERAGVVSRHAIGGAMGAAFYVEPLLTFDLDVFVLLPRSAGGLLALAPLYEALREAREVPYEDVRARVLRAEHLAAIRVQTGRQVAGVELMDPEIAPLLRQRGRQVRVWSL